MSDIEGPEKDKITAQNLYRFFKSVNKFEQLDAVCLVVKASENRLSPSQVYIFNSFLSLLGKYMEKNIMAFFTFSNWTTPVALQAVMEAFVPLPKDENDEPVYFPFNNLPLEKPKQKHEELFKTGWDKGTKSFKEFFKALGQMETQGLRITRKVLKERQSLADSIQSLKSQIKDVEEKHKALDPLRKNLEELRKDMREKNDFQYKENVVVMKKVEINDNATCCTVCEVNCHYPGCWWVKDLSWCSVMKNGKCTFCPGKCSYEAHKKEKYIYQQQKEERTRTDEAQKKEAEGKISEAERKINKLEQELKDIEVEKTKLMESSYQSILKLRKFALKFDTDSTRQNILSLIEILKKNNEREKAGDAGGESCRRCWRRTRKQRRRKRFEMLEEMTV